MIHQPICDSFALDHWFVDFKSPSLVSASHWWPAEPVPSSFLNRLERSDLLPLPALGHGAGMEAKEELRQPLGQKVQFQLCPSQLCKPWADHLLSPPEVQISPW